MGGMARLILEEGGNTRRFKLSTGKLTFGSSDKATLTLTSDDVAAMHGQIEMGEDGAVLRIAKGVTAPKVGGRPVEGRHVMREGQAIAIGGAKLSVEYDEGEGPSAPAPAATVTRPAAGSRDRPGSVRSNARSGRGRSVERQRPTAKRSGMPGWLLALLVLAGIGGVGYAIIGNTAKNMAGDVFNFDVRYAQYERIKDEDPAAARLDLRRIRDNELTPEQKALVAKELLLLDDRLANLDDTARNSDASGYLKMRIFDYAESRPVTKDRSYARLFYKRATKFVEDYPTHPDLAKVNRLLRRVEPVAVLDEPAIFRDLEIETKGLVGQKPMDFPAAFAEINKFIAETNDPDEASQAETLLAETKQAESDLYEAQLDLAAIVYDKRKYPDKFNPGQAVADMVVIITSCENMTFKEDAARRITGITEVGPTFLRGYKRSQPDNWIKMMEVPVLQEFAKANGLTE